MGDKELLSFHFDCGNSNDGHIGFCGRVKALTKEGALAIMKRVLPTEVTIHPVGDDKDNEQVEYIEIYISPDNITLKQVGDGEED
jgi:hypothetical protein